MAYYRGAHGILLVYDVTRRESLENITYWMENIKKNASDKVQVVLIGNKVDRRDASSPTHVPSDLGRQAAESCNVPYFETSALSGQGVDSAFSILSQRVCKNSFVDDFGHLDCGDGSATSAAAAAALRAGQDGAGAGVDASDKPKEKCVIS